MISGTTICLNAVRRDYCLEACLRSLLNVCDEVIAVDGGSDDGTVELVESIEGVKLYHHPVHVRPAIGWGWLREWSEEARMKCAGDMHLYVQADEVLHEDQADLIREMAKGGRPTMMNRLNFWLDKDHILSPGQRVCSQRVVRLAPVENPFEENGDAESLHGFNPSLSDIDIYHYGFIRGPAAFAEKSRVMQSSFFGTCDEIIDRVELNGLEVLAERYPRDTLTPFTGTHPKFIQSWLPT